MKKYMFLSLAAAAMLASCSSDSKVDAPESPAQAIAFNVFANKAARGTGTENQVDMSNFKSFYLYGWNETTKTMIIPEVLATVVEGKATYSPLAYWVSGQKYDFFGIGATEGMAGLTKPDLDYLKTADTFSWPAINFNTATAQGNTDVVTAAASENHTFDKVCPGPVNLSFKHILTRIAFGFERGEFPNSTYSVRLNSVSFVVPGQNADFTPALGDTPGSWGTPKPDSSYTQAYTDWTPEEKINTGVSECHYFIPFVKGVVSFNATLVKDGIDQLSKDFTAQVDGSTLASKEWAMGCSYKLTVTFNMTNFATCPIEFTVTMDDWTEYEFPGAID